MYCYILRQHLLLGVCAFGVFLEKESKKKKALLLAYDMKVYTALICSIVLSVYGVIKTGFFQASFGILIVVSFMYETKISHFTQISLGEIRHCTDVEENHSSEFSGFPLLLP
jgi:hypothetical protein